MYIRFFRSFNHDYLRKSHPDATPRGPWEVLPGGLWYPFTEIGLQKDITTVVGANEAGKTQLLSAIKYALSGEGISQQDFCRYSQFFTVNKTMSHPDFGLRLSGLTDSEGEAVAQACGLDDPVPAEGFHLFRFNNRPPTVYLPDRSGEFVAHAVTNEDALLAVLPQVFEIDSDVPLPDSVPISYLVDGELPAYAERATRQSVVRTLTEKATEWFGTAQAVTSKAEVIASALAPAPDPEKAAEHEREFKLARDLLMTVAGVDESAFVQLQAALSRGSDGQANGIVSQINQELAKHLNFPKYWTQDTDFALLVGLRELDLVFTIRDRTGTDYDFSERSGGLRYFLSYFVQTLAHRPARPLAHEILLMDEPDAFLSSSGQQDLLRIFQDYALPPDGRGPSQVVYVTHSPFLIDKNHSERIRVLDKGQGDEGTRVVANSARNHYEPLRSAFGSFVGETTFISNCNLLLEGQSDQILLAGMSAVLRGLPTPTTQYLDLNQITLVPAGSASHVPYLAYLALGRDADTPAVIALLDSDKAGNDARQALQRGPNGKPILDDKFVLQLGDLDGVTSARAGGAKEIEDLMPPDIVLLGARRYVKDLIGAAEHEKVADIKADQLDLADERGLHEAVEGAFLQAFGEGFHLDKLGLARSIVDVLADAADGSRDQVVANFRLLFQRMNRLQRDANLEVLKKRVGSRVKRARKTFFMDHPETATCEQGGLLLEDLDRQLDDSPVADDWRIELRRVRRQFRLDDELLAPVADYDAFRLAVDGLVNFESRGSLADLADDVPAAVPPKPRQLAAKRARSRQA